MILCSIVFILLSILLLVDIVVCFNCLNKLLFISSKLSLEDLTFNFSINKLDNSFLVYFLYLWFIGNIFVIILCNYFLYSNNILSSLVIL